MPKLYSEAPVTLEETPSLLQKQIRLEVADQTLEAVSGILQEDQDNDVNASSKSSDAKRPSTFAKHPRACKTLRWLVFIAISLGVLAAAFLVYKLDKEGEENCLERYGCDVDSVDPCEEYALVVTSANTPTPKFRIRASDFCQRPIATDGTALHWKGATLWRLLLFIGILGPLQLLSGILIFLFASLLRLLSHISDAFLTKKIKRSLRYTLRSAAWLAAWRTVMEPAYTFAWTARRWNEQVGREVFTDDFDKFYHIVTKMLIVLILWDALFLLKRILGKYFTLVFHEHAHSAMLATAIKHERFLNYLMRPVSLSREVVVRVGAVTATLTGIKVAHWKAVNFVRQLQQQHLDALGKGADGKESASLSELSATPQTVIERATDVVRLLGRALAASRTLRHGNAFGHWGSHWAQNDYAGKGNSDAVATKGCFACCSESGAGGARMLGSLTKGRSRAKDASVKAGTVNLAAGDRTAFLRSANGVKPEPSAPRAAIYTAPPDTSLQSLAAKDFLHAMDAMRKPGSNRTVEEAVQLAADRWRDRALAPGEAAGPHANTQDKPAATAAEQTANGATDVAVIEKPAEKKSKEASANDALSNIPTLVRTSDDTSRKRQNGILSTDTGLWSYLQGNSHLRVLALDAFGGGGPDDDMVELRSHIAAKKLGYYMYWNLQSGEALALNEDDVNAAVEAHGGKPSDAKEFWEILDKNKRGFATLEDTIAAVEGVYNHRKALVNTLQDNEVVLQQVEVAIGAIFLFILVFIGFAIFDPDTAYEYWQAIGTLVVAWSFLFGNPLRVMLENVFYLFLEHPFDVGDTVKIDDIQYTVASVAISHVVLTQVNGAYNNVPLTVLRNKQVHNVNRSKALWDTFSVVVDAEMHLEALEHVADAVKQTLIVESSMFGGTYRVWITDVSSPLKVDILVVFDYTDNGLNILKRSHGKTLLIMAVMKALREAGISFTFPSGGDSGPGNGPDIAQKKMNAGKAARMDRKVAITEDESIQTTTVAATVLGGVA